MPAVYLDNDVVSAITRRDYGQEEMDALDQLLEWHRTGKISLKTSRQSLREMERAPNQYQSGLKKGTVELEIAPNDHKVLGASMLSDLFGGCISSPLVTDIVDEDLYSQLVGINLKDDDAKHLMYAVHNGYEWFVSWNKDFLNRRDRLKIYCPSIRIQKPSELVAELLQDPSYIPS